MLTRFGESNVWIDCMDSASVWHEWAVEQRQAYSERGVLYTNVLIDTELLMPGTDPFSLDMMLSVYDVQRTAMPWPPFRSCFGRLKTIGCTG